MPSVPLLTHLRQRRQEQRKSSPAARVGCIGLGFSILVSCLVAISGIVLTLAYAYLTNELPPPEALPGLLEPPGGLLLQPTRIYDRTGEHIIHSFSNPAVEQREYLKIDGSQGERLPDTLVEATIASADPQFWSRSGSFLESLKRALDLRESNRPTLAERLVREHLLWDEPAGLRRTLGVQLLAAQLTARFGGDKVLEWYLNGANYGRLNYGAQAAAYAYFNKPAKDLSLAEAAVLASVAEAPSLNPHDSPQATRERYRDVLQSMRSQGRITDQQYRQALQEKINFRPPVQSSSNLAPAFTNLVLKQLSEEFDRERILRGGLNIITSLDINLQLQASCAAANQIARLEGQRTEEIPASDGSVCEAARLLPTSSNLQQGAGKSLSTNVVILDPKRGQLIAMVGETEPGLDPANLPGHPPGSLITPFIYLTGFSRGLTPATLLWDIPAAAPDVAGRVNNPDGQFHGPVRLRIALANDYLVTASQVLAQMGAGNVWRTAQQLGLSSLELTSGEAGYRLPFEGGEVTLLDTTRAYGVFADQGLLVGKPSPSAENHRAAPLESVTILQVIDGQGGVWLDCEELQIRCGIQTRPVISAQLAYLMTHILADETARWPSLGHPNSLEIGRPAAAKIGHLEKETDAWTVGYTPSLVAGVWLGGGPVNSDAQVPTAGAAGLWHAIMQYASHNKPQETWEPPPGISTINVCDPSGLLPTVDCPVVVSEVFQAGNEPNHLDRLFQKFQINRETGNLATIFTLPALIEERVYMIVPPEAEEWARQNGLPTVPNSYDSIEMVEPPQETAKVTSPQMFASVKGRVAIMGTAGGQGFSSYRLQAGQGLNPGDWIQIGEDGKTPVTGGKLAQWDTSGLSGLYALQLLVVREDQQVDTHTIQLRVDNQAPEISVRFPEEGQEFVQLEDGVITFQAEASDDLELAEVDFYLDDDLINTLTAPPFAVPWNVEAGEHNLTVTARDRAGNSSRVQVRFAVFP